MPAHKKTPYNLKIEVIQDITAKREWRWRITHKNTNIVGASTEGYRRRIDCLRNLKLVTCLSPPAELLNYKNGTTPPRLEWFVERTAQ